MHHPKGGGKDIAMRTTRLDVKQLHRVGHKPNNPREHKNITTLFASKLKGCVHTNEAKKHPSGSSKGVQSRCPSLR